MNFLSFTTTKPLHRLHSSSRPSNPGNEQDRLLSYWPQLAETTLPGFQEVFGTSHYRLLQRLNPHEPLLSPSVPSRIICYLSCWLYLNKVCPRLNHQCLKQQNLAFGNWALVPINSVTLETKTSPDVQELELGHGFSRRLAQ